jgi:hypothetical protein
VFDERRRNMDVRHKISLYETKQKLQSKVSLGLPY